MLNLVGGQAPFIEDTVVANGRFKPEKVNNMIYLARNLVVCLKDAVVQRIACRVDERKTVM